MDLHIRKASANDFETIWPIFHAVVAESATYPYAKTTTKKQGYHLWMEVPLATYLAEENGKTTGTYYIKPNQPELGAHICNCGYMVAPEARGRGTGAALCLHSQQKAREYGFLAMQFNLVVSTNTTAIHLWKKLDFSHIGTIPKAFNHGRYGLVDALIMYKQLIPEL